MTDQTKQKDRKQADIPDPAPGGPQGIDKDPEQDQPGAPGSDFTEEQKGKKVDGDPALEKDKPSA
jgi:hypothetical protein